ncbi:hypothetical protein BC938DRAFT_473125 [Jimgerdemannia flammicorona]|uniref:F-box domain-containing protein n=1 Tax=Jimgerdemannia flammicorona TaxID=994334 RepID=A0A433QTH4_9FUNG|nr:hypothetical protein BC938DRAFT_473125 [Jimgerdemannia flammicorona]
MSMAPNFRTLSLSFPNAKCVMEDFADFYSRIAPLCVGIKQLSVENRLSYVEYHIHLLLLHIPKLVDIQFTNDTTSCCRDRPEAAHTHRARPLHQLQEPHPPPVRGRLALPPRIHHPLELGQPPLGALRGYLKHLPPSPASHLRLLQPRWWLERFSNHIATILARCPELEYLDLESSLDMIDHTVKAAMRLGRRLKYVDFSHCPTIGTSRGRPSRTRGPNLSASSSTSATGFHASSWRRWCRRALCSAPSPCLAIQTTMTGSRYCLRLMTLCWRTGFGRG